MGVRDTWAVTERAASEGSPAGNGDGGNGDQAVGSFRFWFATKVWEWSEQVYRMYGYQPGEVEPTTELMLEHKHPEDRDYVAQMIARSIARGEPFSSRHRIIDTVGTEHMVLVVADRILDDTGKPVGTCGYYIDLNTAMDEAKRLTLDETLPDLVEARAVIEQAKGVLMRVYRINAEQAFKILVWRSQETNTRLRALAAQLIHDLSLALPAAPEVVSDFDHLLLTAHERIPPE
ncbi:PAS and ANTAR domain-containing protein [Nocardia transvalensis]|uniref:PAS and ANTAR domain-containing protein n=1 Tax=Nocardia transvalensis TaxID=37333 RepID=UPI001895A536|nr:PAS and ANTAR domain-containing protein [Nocardia transvalensis]MBF6328701.1 PAS and ANTAR domain-containing protein [Nocardia transvalensis]